MAQLPVEAAVEKLDQRTNKQLGISEDVTSPAAEDVIAMRIFRNDPRAAGLFSLAIPPTEFYEFVIGGERRLERVGDRMVESVGEVYVNLRGNVFL